MTDDLGAWAPLTIDQIADVFRTAPFRWWISGGHALELHLGLAWRVHDDVDVGICRADAHALHRFLADDWELLVAAEGRLHPWTGDPLSAAADHNNVWCRRDAAAPWHLDVATGSGDIDGWRYRRDESIRRAWTAAVLETTGGVPYLAPELQLLFKSKHPRPKDHTDAQVVIPRLDSERRRALGDLLTHDHPWQRHIGATATTGTEDPRDM